VQGAEASAAVLHRRRQFLSPRPASQQDRERFAEFVAEMRKVNGPTVDRLQHSANALRLSVENLQATLTLPRLLPSSVNEPTQAVGLTFSIANSNAHN
jgi:hypothetical protein